MESEGTSSRPACGPCCSWIEPPGPVYTLHGRALAVGGRTPVGGRSVLFAGRNAEAAVPAGYRRTSASLAEFSPLIHHPIGVLYS